ncbi:GntR family transcriptional regulator [Saccharibacillus alkalitolerans]|uniref:GntR family transcriptional regulator n=1 Tax=Saccharibacillus alkalitolerans TaxID=2705290 RepID=A0ABX0F1G4_9BACL|nr:GntR family transcriptional regulator [Saccharibacillus alkalitolerans]NGZ74811.1 GntR family transcriptional regulator [Saccharibacillus alkalitolerans]
MEMPDLLFRVDSQSPLPLHVQIKEQIKWLIGKDLLKPGDSLPSTNQLAEQLSINRNTIQSVYTQLKDDGLLLMQKGRGTRVAGEDEIARFKASNSHFAFAEKMIEEAREANLSAEDVLLSGFAYMQLFGQRRNRQPRYLFVECKDSSCVFYLDEIKRLTSAEIRSMDLSSLTEEEAIAAIRGADVIVTRSDLAERLKKFADDAGKTVITVGSTRDVPLLLNLVRQP